MTPRSTPRNASANRMARAHVGSTAPVRCLGGGGGGGAAANNGDCERDGSYAGGGGGAGGGVKAGGGVGSSGDCQSVSGPSRLPVAASGWGVATSAVFAVQSGHSLYAGGTSRL